MYIPHDIVNLIIDNLVLEATNTAPATSRYGMVCPKLLARDLRATSLVSTHWVNHSQHYLFSTIALHLDAHVREWCSRIEPNPRGVSRHVRVLKLRGETLHSDILEPALPHFTSFRNLQDLGLDHDQTNLGGVSLDHLVPIFSSFGATLKRLQWSQGAITPNPWKTLYTLADLLPNIVELDLSRVQSNRCLIRPPNIPRINLSSGCQPPDLLAFKHKFQELWVTVPVPSTPGFFKYCGTHLRVLDLWGLRLGSDGDLRSLFAVCHELQEVTFPFYSFIGRALALCPSNSVSLICIHDPPSATRTTFNNHIPRCLEDPCDSFKHSQMQECESLCASIRKISQKFSTHNYGSKLRVQVICASSVELGGEAAFDKETSFFVEKLEEELGTHITLELDLLPLC